MSSLPAQSLTPQYASSPRIAVRIAIVIWLVVMVITQRAHDQVLGRLFVPDGIEYAVGAKRLATYGRYEIIVDNVAHPPRYPPGFSCLLAPAYFLSDDLIAGVWISRAIWAAGCAALAYALTRRWGGVTAFVTVAAINIEPVTARMASTIMADAPGVAVMLALLAIRIVQPLPTRRTFFLAGLVAAVGVGCRPLAIVFLLPFLLALPRDRTSLRAAAMLCAPSFAIIALTLVYNRLTFGSFWMSGYTYWLPDPHSEMSHVFYPSYAIRQLRSIAASTPFLVVLAIGVIAAITLGLFARSQRRTLLVPLALLAIPVTVIHLFYFFIQARLFLPLLVACTLVAGCSVGFGLQRLRVGREAGTLLSIAMFVYMGYAAVMDVNPASTLRSDLLQQMQGLLPERCQIITTMEPDRVFEFLGPERRWIAAERNQEYANNIIANRPLDLTGIRRPPTRVPPPVLLERGGARAVAHTADEDAVLDALARPGSPPIYVDIASLQTVPGLRERLEQRFMLLRVPDAPLLIRCERRGAASPSTTPSSIAPATGPGSGLSAGGTRS